MDWVGLCLRLGEVGFCLFCRLTIGLGCRYHKMGLRVIDHLSLLVVPNTRVYLGPNERGWVSLLSFLDLMILGA